MLVLVLCAGAVLSQGKEGIGIKMGLKSWTFRCGTCDHDAGTHSECELWICVCNSVSCLDEDHLTRRDLNMSVLSFCLRACVEVCVFKLRSL